MVTAKELFNDYCFYRQHTAHVQKLKQDHPYIRDLKETPARLKLFAHMAKWCADKQIDPQAWLYSLFGTRRWMFAPKLERGHLQSEKHLPKFQRFRDYAFFRRRQAEKLELASMDSTATFDPNRDISHAAEEAKRRYLQGDDTKTCMEKTDAETFGFHPRSTICGGCSAKSACEARLVRSVRFDILALRRGEITSKEAHAQALARAQGYGR